MKANRALFKKYIQTTHQKEKHLIEKEFVEDDFVMDALEGYSQEPGAWSGFEAADKKFFKTQRNRRLALFSFGLLVSLSLGWYFIPAAAKRMTLQKQEELTQVQTIKIHQKADIKKMIAAAPKERISPKQVILDLQANSNTLINKAEALERIQQIPATQVEFKNQKEQRLAIKIGRELYIKNFKVIDYRYYRKSERNTRHTYSENEVGEQDINIPYINLLSKAIEDFAQQDYKLALLHFDEILQTYPDDANALFYGGMCLYNLRVYEQAESRLLKLQSIPFANFSEEAEWYLLHVYQQAKKEAAFSGLQKSIIDQKGFYAQKAANLKFN
jgi:tetratricopeptide (TPR) repeat protein